MAIRDLLVRIRGDSTEVDRELLRTSRSVQKFGRDMGQVGQRLTVGLTLPILGAGAAALKMSANAQESEAKFKVVFGSMGSEVRAFSDSMADSFGRSAVELRGFLSSFQDTFVPLGFARDEASELSRVLTQSTLDLAAFYDRAEPEVVQRLTSALVGNHEAVRIFGAVLTEATLKQELIRMGIEGGTKAATNQEKVLARLNLILDQTADAAGTAARESEGATAGWRALTSAVRDATRVIGDQALPLGNELQRMVTGLVRGLGELNPSTVRWGIALAGAAAVVGPALATFGTLATVLAKIASTLAVGMLPLIGTGGAVLVGLTALAAAFLKVKIDAAAAREEVAGFGESLRGLSLDQLQSQMDQINAKKRSLEADIARDEGFLAIAGLPRSTQRSLRKSIDRAKEQLRVLLESRFEVFREIARLHAEAEASLDDPAAGEGGQATTPANPALRLMGWDRQMYFTRGFGRENSKGGFRWSSPDFLAGIEKFREGLEVISMSPAALREAGQEAEILVETMAPLEELAATFVGGFADTFADALRTGTQAFQRFADFVIQQTLRIVARFGLFKLLEYAFPGGSGAIGQLFGLQSGFLTPATISGGSGVPGAAPQLASGLDLSRMPPAMGPMQVARDQQWAELIEQTLRELGR